MENRHVCSISTIVCTMQLHASAKCWEIPPKIRDTLRPCLVAVIAFSFPLNITTGFPLRRLPLLYRSHFY